ncbi:MAG: hypothetical protein K6E45_03135 [Bacteroidaceae bacterium]|nr:hypothetical protein [Bacteroidaceae bacterium]
MKGKFDKEVITQLLSRFMSGETSLDEEKTLADYFRTHEVEAEWLEYKQMFALFDNGQVDVAGSVRTWHPFRWLAAGIAAGIILLVGLPLLLKDDTAKEKTPVIARQSVSRTSPQPVPQPVAEEKTENAMAEVQLAPQPVRQPARKRRKAAQGSDDDIQSAPVEEPMPAQAEPMGLQEEKVPDIPADKQALADIFFAEVALQVDYELSAQQEELRAYAASLTGQELPKTVIAF